MTSLASIALPDDIIWLDEFDFDRTLQSVSRSAGGRHIVQYGALYSGRPITLKCHWLNKTALDALIALRDTAGSQMALIMPDARAFNVMFRSHESGAISAPPVIDYPTYSASDLFDVTLKLMEV